MKEEEQKSITTFPAKDIHMDQLQDTSSAWILLPCERADKKNARNDRRRAEGRE